MVNKMGKAILESLKPKGKKYWDLFLNIIHSLKTGITYDAMGQPSWNVSVGDIANPNNTLDEIFSCLQKADRPCLVAIDEFQQILKYEDTNVEAALRTYVQYCSNARFVFMGSQRHLMGAMFVSPNRPFYQSITVIFLRIIGKEGKVSHITSGKFSKRHGLVSPSAVKSSINALLYKDLLTQNKGVYQVYDKFLEIWLKRQ